MIRRQCYHPEGEGFIFQLLKTRLETRTIQVGEGVIDHLRAQLQVVDEYRKQAGDTRQEIDLVFSALLGTPLQPYRLSGEFPALAKKAGLPEIRFHDCRHTAATLMLSHGIPPFILWYLPFSIDIFMVVIDGLK